MSKWRVAFSAVALLTLGSVPAFAQQSYPSRHITMVVPFAAGGPTDIVGRIVAEHMSRTLGQQIVIENAAGAVLSGRRSLSDALAADPVVTGALDPDALERALDPTEHLGAADAFIEHALAHAKLSHDPSRGAP